MNAAFFRLLDGYVDRAIGERKRALLTEMRRRRRRARPGVGANFRYLAPGTSVTAVEPNRRMHSGLRRQARAPASELHIVERQRRGDRPA